MNRLLVNIVVVQLQNTKKKVLMVGYFYNEYDYQHERNVQKFKRVKSFTDQSETARYCHYLNGGDSNYYDA